MEYDESTGLYYDHARYYHPGINRFLSTDISRSTADPFSYTDGDPVNYVDPDGRMMDENLLSTNNDDLQSIVSVPMSEINANDNIDLIESTLNSPLTISNWNASRNYGASDINSTLANIGVSSQSEDSQDSLDWVRYPTFWKWTWDVEKGQTAPQPKQKSNLVPTKEEKEVYNKKVHEGYVQGWTRTGGYLQSLLSSFLLAWWFPTSDNYTNRSPAGFWIDAGVYLLTVTAFSGYGKSYTANAAYYWQGITKNGYHATGWDYAKLGLRRIVQKTITQVIAFSGISLLGRYLRGYRVFDPDLSTTNELMWLAIRNFAFASIGSAFMLAYYLPTKAPSASYDDELAENNYNNSKWDAVENSWFLKRWYTKASHAYRMFNKRKGYWETPNGSKLSRAKSWGWYAAYVTQMYVWYLVGSLGYYTGFATIAKAHPQVNSAVYFASWRSNLAQIILSPAASPLAWMLNSWARKSFTIIKKRSKKRPRTPNGSWGEWLGYKILGPIEGLRLARYDDASYMPLEDWLPALRSNNNQNIRLDTYTVPSDSDTGSSDEDEMKNDPQIKNRPQNKEEVNSDSNSDSNVE
jgi:hypothetical protein